MNVLGTHWKMVYIYLSFKYKPFSNEFPRHSYEATSERDMGIFSKIAFLESLHSKEKDELCPGFEVEIFTKSLHRGGVGHKAV